MPINFIKKWFYEKEIKNQKPFDGASLPNSIGIFITTEKENPQVNELKRTLHKMGYNEENIFILSYLPSKIQNNEKADAHTYTLNDVNWFGIPKSTAINDFIKRRYEKFYYLCPILEGHQKYVVLGVAANFKAAVYSPGVEKLFDLTIDAPFISINESFREIQQMISKLTHHAK